LRQTAVIDAYLDGGIVALAKRPVTEKTVLRMLEKRAASMM
jgi:hypothetical protein